MPMSSINLKNQQLKGQLAIFFAAFLWSTSGLFIKMIDWNPVVIAGTRSFIAVLFLLAVRCISPPPKGVKNKAIPLWACAFAFAFTVITYTIAIKLTTAANTILLQYGAPIWAALLGWYLVKEKPNWEQWAALALVVIGLLLFFSEGLEPGALLGNILAIISGILFGAHTVFLRMLKDGSPVEAMLLAHVICAALSIPLIILYPPVLKAATVLPILYMGLMQIGLASLLFSYGIKRTTAIQAMLTAILDPLLNPVWVLIVLGEKPALQALVGGAIIISSVVFSSLIGFRREAKSS
jgi:drug/metabolite transporter (DMT)-like permease